MGAVTNQEKHWRGVLWPCVRWRTPPPSSSSSLWIDAGIPGAIFSLSVVESRAWVEERKGRESRKRRSRGGEEEGEELKRGMRRGEGRREEEEEEGEGGDLYGGGVSHADFNCSSINTKLPAVRALNRDQTSQETRRRGAPCHFLHAGRYRFLWICRIFCFYTSLKLYRALKKMVGGKNHAEGGLLLYCGKGENMKMLIRDSVQ